MKNKILVIVFCVVLLDMLGVGVLIPVIPQLLGNPESPYYLLSSGASLQSGYIMLGWLAAIFPLMMFFSAPILGQLSDKYGRRKILMFSVAGTSISYMLFAFAVLTRNIPLLFVSRAIDGITGGNISVAQAAIADSTKPEERARSFGLIGAAFGLGFILGPFLGGKLSDPTLVSWFGASTPFWFSAILSALNVIAIFLWLPETRKNVEQHVKILWNKSLSNIMKAFQMVKLRRLFVTSFFMTAGFTFFTTFFGVYLIEKFSYNQGQIGDFFAVIGVFIVLTQGILVRWVSKKYSEEQVLAVSLFALGNFILAYYLPVQSWQLFLVVPFFAMANGLTMANLNAFISKNAGEGVQGEVLGINSGVQALAQSIPALLSGYAAAILRPDTPILVGGTLVIVAWMIFVGKSKKHQVFNG